MGKRPQAASLRILDQYRADQQQRIELLDAERNRWCLAEHNGHLCQKKTEDHGPFHEATRIGRWRVDGKGEFEDAVDIIKTWPANTDPRVAARIFRTRMGWATYYFTLSRGRVKKPIRNLWFTYRGRIVGYFPVEQVVVNDGTLPKLRRLDGEESDWQIKPDASVAICQEDCVPLRERLFMDGFRGFRYFDLAEHQQTPYARMRL